MTTVTPGHAYLLAHFEPGEDRPQFLQFIQKEIKHSPECALISEAWKLVKPTNCTCGAEFKTVNNGTTNEEVLAVLIDRINFLNAKAPCRENSIVLTHLETALLWLNKRTADRKARGVEGTPKV